MMARRRLNIKVLLLLIGGVVASVVGVYLVHGIQVRRTASYLLVMADRHEKEGEDDKVVTDLELYNGFRPDDVEGLARLGHALDKTGKGYAQKSRAAGLLETVARKDPARVADLRRAAEIYSELGKNDPQMYKIAQPIWKAFLDKEPTDGVVEGKLAQSEEASAQFDAAEAHMVSAIKHAPKVVDLYLQYASFLLNRRQARPKATKVVDDMVAANPNEIRAFIERAKFRMANKLPGAKDDVDRAGRFDPESVDVALLRSQLALRDGKAGDATAALAKALAANPKDTRLILSTAFAQLSDSKGPAALATLKAGIEALPESAELRWTYADYLLQLDKVDEAAPVVEDIGKRLANSPPTRYLDARVLFARRSWSEASRKFAMVVDDLGPWPEMARMARYYEGIAYERLFSPEQALASFNRVVALAPDWIPGKLKVATTLASLGRIEEALRAYRAIPTDTPGVKAAMVRLRLGQNARLAESDRRWDDIDAAVAEVAGPDPTSADLIALKAEVMIAKGKLSDARALYEAARAKFPDEPQYPIGLAGLYQAANDNAKALATLDEAEAKFGDTPAIRVAKARYWSTRGGQEAPTALASLRDNLGKFTKVQQAEILDGLANANLRLGNRGESGQLRDQAIQADPDNLRLRLTQLEAAIASGRDDSVREVVAQIRRIEGENGAYWRIAEASRLIVLAKKEKSLVGVKDARTLAADAIKRRPELPEAFRLLGDADDLEHDDESAIANYQKSIAFGGRSIAVLARLSDLLVSKGRHAEANKAIRSLETQAVMTPEMKRMAAEVALRARDEARALTLVGEAVTATSKSVPDLIWQTQMYASMKKFAESEATARRAVAVDPTVPGPWLTLIRAIVLAGSPQRAAAEAELAEKAVGEKYTLERAEIAAASGKLDVARTRYNAAVAARPDDPRALREAARFFAASGAGAQAVPLLRKALNPEVKADEAEKIAIRRTLASVLLATRRPKILEEAESLVAENLKARPDSEDDVRLRAEIIGLEPGRTKEAIKAYEDLRSRFTPTSLELLRLAQLYDADGQWTPARQIALNILNGKSVLIGAINWYAGKLLDRRELGRGERLDHQVRGRRAQGDRGDRPPIAPPRGDRPGREGCRPPQAPGLGEPGHRRGDRPDLRGHGTDRRRAGRPQVDRRRREAGQRPAPDGRLPGEAGTRLRGDRLLRQGLGDLRAPADRLCVQHDPRDRRRPERRRRPGPGHQGAPGRDREDAQDCVPLSDPRHAAPRRRPRGRGRGRLSPGRRDVSRRGRDPE